MTPYREPAERPQPRATLLEDARAIIGCLLVVIAWGLMGEVNWMGLIVVDACGETCSGREDVTCTLVKGHDGMHVDETKKLAWGRADPTPEDFARMNADAQLDVLRSRDDAEHAFAREMRARSEDYDREQGTLARAHGWALEEAQAWARFAAAVVYAGSVAMRGTSKDETARAFIAESSAQVADAMLEEWRRRFTPKRYSTTPPDDGGAADA